LTLGIGAMTLAAVLAAPAAAAGDEVTAARDDLWFSRILDDCRADFAVGPPAGLGRPARPGPYRDHRRRGRR